MGAAAGQAFPRRGADAGATLVEALAALTLLAVAGAVVASAAGVGLRALHTATVDRRLVALAARELAALQTRAPEPAAVAARLAEPELAGEVRQTTEVDETAGLATLRVAVAAAGRRVELTTRRGVPW